MVAVIGILLSIGGSLNLRRAELEQVRFRFGRAVGNDVSVLDAVTARHEAALKSLRSRFGSGSRVSREEFRAATTEILTENPSFAALEWVPRVPASERNRVEAGARADGLTRYTFFEREGSGSFVSARPRPEYWPVLYVEPVAANLAILGHDLRSDPAAAAIELARDSGETCVTRPLNIYPNRPDWTGFAAIVPVYAPNVPGKTLAQRRAAFRGAVVGVSRIEDVFDEALHEKSELPYDFALFDQSSDVEAGKTLLFYRAGLHSREPAPGKPASGNFAISVSRSVGQRNWAFYFRASPEWIARNSSLAPTLALGIGLLATAMVCGLLLGVDRQTRIVEGRVQRRTVELREANARLEREANDRRQVETALRQSERSLVEAQRIARLGRWESDPTTGTLKWSYETYRIFGLEPAQFDPSIENFYALVHPEDRAYVRQQVQAAVSLGITYRLVHRIVLPDGTVRHVEENAELVRGEAGGMARLVGTVLDITERRRIEETLAHERNLLRTLVDAIPDPIVVKDLQGRYVLLNRANARALKVEDPTAAIGKTDADFQPEEQAVRQAEDDRRVTESGARVINREELITSPDGVSGWFLTTKIPLHDERGNVTGLVSVGRDITEGHRIREELEREHNLLRTLIDTLPDFVYVKDAAGRYLLTNEANRRLLGLAAVSDAIGKTIHELFPAEFARLYEEDDRRVIEHGEFVLNREHPMRFPDGRTGWILTTKVPIRDRDGRVTAVFGVSRDITEHRRLQAEREEMDRRLNQSQKLESLGALAGGVAHDFNNILTIVLNNATLAKSHPEDPVLVRESLGQIEHAAERAAHLCNQMLAYSGRGQFVIQPISLADLIEDTLPLLRSGISRRAQLEVVAEPCAAVAQADVTQIRQIILNLVINASDALGDAAGSIKVTTGLMRADAAYLSTTYLAPELGAGQFVFLEVSDTGCGMSAETIAKIFEPFFSTKFTGRGLGLAAVLGIVRGHHGAIKVTSAPGAGTTFRLLLPAVQGVVPKPLHAGTPPPSAAKAGGRVLVVDDEEFILSVMCRSLQRLGFEPVAAASGEEAIRLLEGNPKGFAAVLLDLTMPRMDGQKTFEELRRINPDIPVLLMSGFSELEATGRFAGQGLAGFIQKPFQLASLVEQLRNVIQNTGK